jgi:hypothetical protein
MADMLNGLALGAIGVGLELEQVFLLDLNQAIAIPLPVHASETDSGTDPDPNGKAYGDGPFVFETLSNFDQESRNSGVHTKLPRKGLGVFARGLVNSGPIGFSQTWVH